MKHPHPGEILYTDPGPPWGMRVKVVRVEGTTVWYIPADREVVGTHQGNLYDENGERKYSV